MSDAWQDQLKGILSARGPRAASAPALVGAPGPAKRPFSPFLNEDLERATELASRLMRTAEAKPGDEGLAEAVAEAEDLVADEPAGLVQYALALFVTHYPAARDKFRVQPLERRQPNLVLPSARTSARTSARASATTSATTSTTTAAPAAGSTPPENQLDYWREDPLLNEHHEHWHLVYPTSGRPSPTGGFDLGDRHGELFAYMHEQMLARYDAERVSVGVARVAAFNDFRAKIPQGYDPGPLRLWDGDTWTAFRARPANATISDLTAAPFDKRPGALLATQTYFRNRLLQAAATGHYEFKAGPITMPQGDVAIDTLGNTVEANANSVDNYGPGDPYNNKSYGNLHNDGHIHFMLFDDDNTKPIGVMGTTSAAVRDPIFFRWHKQVDAVFEAFQKTLPPYDFSDGPPAKLLSIDVDPPVDLITEMLERTIDLQDENGKATTATVRYLSHDDFSYLFKVENPLDHDLTVTARVFLAPTLHEHDRTTWIEMDKFLWTLTPGENALTRRSDQSSVIRKPALRPADLQASDEPNPATDQQSWCDCGWPYTLLLPRGNASGMLFRILAMLSSGDDLTPPPSDHCTSISYCGLQDKDYPDKRAMGYPFDRPFAKKIIDTADAHDNWATTLVTIRCKSD